MLPRVFNSFLDTTQNISFLNEEQVNTLTLAFQSKYDNARTNFQRRKYGRHWLIFLVLRYTGARVSEVLNLTHSDINFRSAEIKLITLKRHKRHNPKKNSAYRIIPVPANVTSEIATFIMQYPDVKNELFRLNRSFFYRVFRKRCDESEIPRELSHPHILRHTRAIELLRAGVPVTVVQNLLGHSALTTTAVYLRISNSEAKQILRDRGLI